MTETLLTKQCSKCKCIKSVNEFYVQKGKGRVSACKICQSIRNKERYTRPDVNYRIKCNYAKWYKKNKKKKDASHRIWRIKNRFKEALKNTASKSIEREYAPCIATEEEIREVFTGFCHACGVPEIECKNNLCLDHDHKSGQAKGWLCQGCNLAKGNLRDSPERALLLAEYIKRTQILEKREIT